MAGRTPNVLHFLPCLHMRRFTHTQPTYLIMHIEYRTIHCSLICGQGERAACCQQSVWRLELQVFKGGERDGRRQQRAAAEGLCFGAGYHCHSSHVQVKKMLCFVAFPSDAWRVYVTIHSRQTTQSQHCAEYRPSIAFFSPSGVAPLFLLLACDGVFDTMENTIVGSIAHKVTLSLRPPALIHCSAPQHA